MASAAQGGQREDRACCVTGRMRWRGGFTWGGGGGGVDGGDVIESNF